MKKERNANIELHKSAARKAARAEYVANLRDGRKLRATTYADRKAVANKRACRGRVEA